MNSNANGVDQWICMLLGSKLTDQGGCKISTSYNLITVDVDNHIRYIQG